MGLNMNYTLLTGEHSSKYHIPEYNSKASLNVYSESFMIQALSDFRQEIRESKNMLSEICNNSNFVNEGNISSAIYVGIFEAIDRVIKAIRRLKEMVFNAIDRVITKFKKLILEKQDELEKKHSFYEREQMLKKALSHTDAEDIKINIVDIKPSQELLNDKFPDTSVLSDTRLHSDIEDLCTIERNTREFKDGMGADALDPERSHVETLVSAIEADKERLLSATFGNYSYEITDIMGSAKRVAEEAFGKNEYSDVELSRELYGQACDNIDNLKKIVDGLETLKKDYMKEYNTIENNLTALQSGINKTLSNPNTKMDVPLKKAYYDASQSIASALQRGLNVINSIVSANYTLFIHKNSRINSIIDSSYKVKNLAHRLIRRDLKIEEDTAGQSNVQNESSEIFNGHDTIVDLLELQNDFSITTELINEAMLEKSFSENLYSIINEEGEQQQAAQPAADNGGNNNAPAATEPGATNVVNKVAQGVQKAGSTILAWLNNIIGKLGDTFNRFKNRIDELIIKNGPDKEWWNKNKENIKKLNLADTKANDWYKFDFDVLNNANSFVSDFDVNQEYMKSDEAMQEAIIKKITANPPQFDEKDTFAQKINKIYQGGAPVSDKNSDGQTLQSLGYDHNKACEYIDNMINKGFASPSLGGVNDDYKKLSDQRKDVNTNYGKYASDVKASTANAPAEEKKEEPQNASAIENEDFRFNLAEHFGLIHNEASFVVGQQSAQSATDNGAGENAGSGSNKELDAMIKRYFNYNTIAVTAKMTSAVSAYKQYMSLIKAVYKKPAQKKDDGQAKQQNNQNATTEEKK